MLDDLVAAINRLLPEAPYPYRSQFAQTAPWLALLSAALGLIIGGRYAPLIGAVSAIANGYPPDVLSLLYGLSPVLALVSIPGLRNQQKWGWILFTLSVLIDFLIALLFLALTLSFNLLFSLLFDAIILYYLLQSYSEYGRRYWR
jgi:hypothetical protein